jgi:hypothetical protein
VTILIHGILEVRNSIRRIYKTKNSKEVAELINPESQTPQSKIKNAGTNPFFLKLTIRNFPT